MREVSRNRPPTQDHKSALRSRIKEVGLARISYSDDNFTVACSCGWHFGHRREKVREDSIDRHLDKHHYGRGIRL